MSTSMPPSLASRAFPGCMRGCSQKKRFALRDMSTCAAERHVSRLMAEPKCPICEKRVKGTRALACGVIGCGSVYHTDCVIDEGFEVTSDHGYYTCPRCEVEDAPLRAIHAMRVYLNELLVYGQKLHENVTPRPQRPSLAMVVEQQLLLPAPEVESAPSAPAQLQQEEPMPQQEPAQEEQQPVQEQQQSAQEQQQPAQEEEPVQERSLAVRPSMQLATTLPGVVTDISREMCLLEETPADGMLMWKPATTSRVPVRLQVDADLNKWSRVLTGTEVDWLSVPGVYTFERKLVYNVVMEVILLLVGVFRCAHGDLDRVRQTLLDKLIGRYVQPKHKDVGLGWNYFDALLTRGKQQMIAPAQLQAIHKWFEETPAKKLPLRDEVDGELAAFLDETPGMSLAMQDARLLYRLIEIMDHHRVAPPVRDAVEGSFNTGTPATVKDTLLQHRNEPWFADIKGVLMASPSSNKKHKKVHEKLGKTL